MPLRASSLAGAVLCAAWIGACESSSADDPNAGAGGTAGAAVAGATAGGSAGQGGRTGAGAPANGGTATAGRGGTAGGPAGPGGSGAAGGAPSDDPCDGPDLVWRSANKTNYTSYPDPGSEECVKYNGCMWAGQFAACDGKKAEDWVASHNIVAAFPDFRELELHDLCLRKGDKTIVVTVLDTCGDSDCDGCCTENRGSADQLIDVESYTNDRWGVSDGAIEWADLGVTTGDGCGG